MLILLGISLFFFAGISFARYTQYDSGYNDSNVAKFKLVLNPYQAGNLQIDYKGLEDTSQINCSYLFTVCNYDSSDTISEISYQYQVYYIVSEEISDSLSSVRLTVLDEYYESTNVNYTMTITDSYVKDGVTYYLYTCSQEFSFYANVSALDRYSVDFVINTSGLKLTGGESFKLLEDMKIQVYATQIIGG